MQQQLKYLPPRCHLPFDDIEAGAIQHDLAESPFWIKACILQQRRYWSLDSMGQEEIGHPLISSICGSVHLRLQERLTCQQAPGW